MIGRLLASAAFAVALTGTALIGTAQAQMSAPPPSNPSASPSANDASHATGAPTATTPSKPTMGQRAMQDMKDAGHKVKSAFSGDKSKSSGGMSASKQTAQGHEQDNVADKLNACEAKPMAERQSCIDSATRM